MPHPFFGAKDVCYSILKKRWSKKIKPFISCWGGQLELVTQHCVAFFFRGEAAILPGGVGAFVSHLCTRPRQSPAAGHAGGQGTAIFSRVGVAGYPEREMMLSTKETQVSPCLLLPSAFCQAQPERLGVVGMHGVSCSTHAMLTGIS